MIRHPWLLPLLTLGMVFADRALKHLALAGVTLGPASGGGRFELFPNPDIAFSVTFPSRLTLIVVPIILIIFLFWALRLFRRGDLLRSAALFSVVIAAMSNYLDRWQRSYVVDYLSLGNWFPVFNLSDVVIAAMLVLFITAPKSATREQSSATERS